MVQVQVLQAIGVLFQHFHCLPIHNFRLGTFGRAVDSDTKELRFEYSLQQFYQEHLFISNFAHNLFYQSNCIEKTKVKMKKS